MLLNPPAAQIIMTNSIPWIYHSGEPIYPRSHVFSRMLMPALERLTLILPLHFTRASHHHLGIDRKSNSWGPPWTHWTGKFEGDRSLSSQPSEISIQPTVWELLYYATLLLRILIYRIGYVLSWGISIPEDTTELFCCEEKVLNVGLIFFLLLFLFYVSLPNYM